MAVAHPGIEQRLHGLLGRRNVTTLKGLANPRQGTLGVGGLRNMKAGKRRLRRIQITRLQRGFQGREAFQPFFQWLTELALTAETRSAPPMRMSITVSISVGSVCRVEQGNGKFGFGFTSGWRAGWVRLGERAPLSALDDCFDPLQTSYSMR